MCHDEPDKIIAAKNGSPLVVGLGDKENYVASDTSAIIDYTRNILFLEDDEIIELTKTSYKIKHIAHEKIINKEIKKIEYSLEAIEKGKYEHFMLKEIFQQPISIADSYRGRVLKNNQIKLGGIEDYYQRILDCEYIYITACGTSWHAAQIGSYIIEEVLGKPVKVEYASEFRYRESTINNKTERNTNERRLHH